MNKLKKSPNLAVFLIVTFLTFMTFGTTLTSCGGSSSGSGGSTTTDTYTFSSFQSATTDSNGQATFTTSKLTNATSTKITLTLPNGQAGSGLKVNFSDTDDQHVMFFIYDPDGNYQTTFATVDASSLNASASVLDRNFHLEKVPMSASLEKGKLFGIDDIILVAAVALVATVTAISLADRINKLSGTIDPVRLVTGEPECFSADNLLEYYSIATDSVGLVFWTGAALASGGTTALYELLLDNIAESAMDTVEGLFWDEVISTALTGMGIERTTKMCWQLYNPFTDSSGSIRYDKIYEMRPDKTCSTSADCSSITALAQTLNAIDGDGDGYTINQSDCDDQNKNIYPGAFEVCDSGIDYNCDGALTTCNITTTNLYMDNWPTGGSLSNGGSGDASLVMLQGSFIGTGSDTFSTVHIFVNDNTEQVKSTTDYGGGQFGFWDIYTVLKPGLNRIQVAGQGTNAGNTHYGSETYTFTNTNTTSALTIMLSWDACPNLDLYIVEPDSSVVHPGSTTGNYGSMTYASPSTSGYGPDVYKALNPAAGQTYYYYVKHAGNGSCGESGHSAFYTIRVFTPNSSTTKTGTILDGGTSSMYDIEF